MTKRGQVYKCSICGNIVELLHEGAGALICCNTAMGLMAENGVDAAVEKHVPVIKETGSGYEVLVGETLHPMEEKHYIEWIELIVDNQVYRKYLKAGEEPKAVFEIKGSKVYARAYCNLHGLWKSN